MSDQHETVTVPREPIEWLKTHYPALCEKAGLCERIGGRLYTRTVCAPHPPTGDAAGKDSVDAARYLFLRDGAEITEGLHIPCHVTFPELPAESSVRARVGAEFDAAVDSAVDFAIASLTKTADGEKT
jgi:hypothetical protein